MQNFSRIKKSQWNVQCDCIKEIFIEEGVILVIVLLAAVTI